ncbi:hypothetical protein [Streptomyces sp. NPDC097610]|uniref:hypothetical protein n=1 Tax=Streptomyces sp. NPDC097610 TaxID=3157227 RepID=UPI00331F20D6
MRLTSSRLPDQSIPAVRNASNRCRRVTSVMAANGIGLPGITLAALRFARANDPAFPGSVDKRGAELLYHVGDLKRWARNRPRAATGTTDLD